MYFGTGAGTQNCNEYIVHVNIYYSSTIQNKKDNYWLYNYKLQKY